MMMQKKGKNQYLIPLSKQNYVHFETKALCNNIISSKQAAVGRWGYDEYVFTFIKWFATLRYSLEAFGIITVALPRPACKASGKIFAFNKIKRRKISKMVGDSDLLKMWYRFNFRCITLWNNMLWCENDFKMIFNGLDVLLFWFQLLGKYIVWRDATVLILW